MNVGALVASESMTTSSVAVGVVVVVVADAGASCVGTAAGAPLTTGAMRLAVVGSYASRLSIGHRK